MLTFERYAITWLEKTDSTSGYVRMHIEDLPDFSVVCAVEQSEGRGSKDHLWHSSPGENLTFSILVRFDEDHPLSASEEALLMKASSLAETDFLRDYGISAAIKLPNDIYVNDKKICGTLIEHSTIGGKLKWSIIGIGIDINQTVFPSWVPNPVSMRLLTGKEYDIKKCLENFLRHFSLCYDAIWTDREELSLRHDGLVSAAQSQRQGQQP